MKKLFVCAMLMGLVLPAIAADAIYKGDAKKEAVCYFFRGSFYADSARKKLIYNHPGNAVSKEKGRVNAKNAIYRLMGDKIYKGYSVKKDDCIATIVDTKTRKGNTVEAKIYEGWAVPRDKVGDPEKGGITSIKVTSDGISKPAGKVLYTISGNKIYKGDSTDAKDCVLNYTGDLNASRLLFVCIELAK